MRWRADPSAAFAQSRRGPQASINPTSTMVVWELTAGWRCRGLMRRAPGDSEKTETFSEPTLDWLTVRPPAPLQLAPILQPLLLRALQLAARASPPAAAASASFAILLSSTISVRFQRENEWTTTTPRRRKRLALTRPTIESDDLRGLNRPPTSDDLILRMPVFAA